MRVTLEGVGKKFQREWVFKNFNHTFETGRSYAITGPNGSGKSTLLKVIAGIIPVNSGRVSYNRDGQEIDDAQFFRHIVITAPYMDLIEEFTLMEFLKFHFRFKRKADKLDLKEIAAVCMLEEAMGKPIRNFSSGMIQRLKLGLCFFTDVPVVLLDEPTSNLDQQGIEWFLSGFENYLKGKMVLICSNREVEYQSCDEKIDITKWK